MHSNENLLPTPLGTSVHRLEGNVLRRWWQIPRAVRAHKNDVAYANAGMQQTLVTLITLPVWTICSYLKCGSLKIAAPVMILWLGLFLLLLTFFRRHRHHVLTVTASETGLELRSPFLQRNIRWLDIADFFPAGTIEPKEFVVQCRNGEEFFLSKDLTDSASLFDLITCRMAHPEVTYDLNYRIQDGLFDACRLLAVIIIACFIIWPIAQWLLGAGGHPGPNYLANVIVFGLIEALALAWCWLQLMKTPQLIRAGRLGLYVRTGSQGKLILWDQITKISQIAGWLIVNSRLGWFVMFPSKKEPMAERLLEYKRESLMLNQKRF